jgi:hypothetical protein
MFYVFHSLHSDPNHHQYVRWIPTTTDVSVGYHQIDYVKKEFDLSPSGVGMFVSLNYAGKAFGVMVSPLDCCSCSNQSSPYCY